MVVGTKVSFQAYRTVSVTGPSAAPGSVTALVAASVAAFSGRAAHRWWRQGLQLQSNKRPPTPAIRIMISSEEWRHVTPSGLENSTDVTI